MWLAVLVEYYTLCTQTKEGGMQELLFQCGGGWLWQGGRRHIFCKVLLDALGHLDGVDHFHEAVFTACDLRLAKNTNAVREVGVSELWLQHVEETHGSFEDEDLTVVEVAIPHTTCVREWQLLCKHGHTPLHEVAVWNKPHHVELSLESGVVMVENDLEDTEAKADFGHIHTYIR